MKRYLLALALAAGFAALGTSVAFADGGPHGGYTNPITLPSGTNGVLTAGSVNTDGCAGCHRMHTAQTNYALLRDSSIYQVCADCHNGTGSVLDVLDGVRLGALQSSQPTATTAGLPLNGGGFEYFKGLPVSSRHQMYTGPYTSTNASPTDAWGAGVAPPGQTAQVGASGTTLDCISCHNQHGGGATAQYRMLKAGAGKSLSVMAYAPADPQSTTPTYTANEFGRGLDQIVSGGVTYAPPSTKYTTAYYAEAGLTANSTVTVTVSGTTTAVTAGMGGFFGPDTPVNIAARKAIIYSGTVTSGPNPAVNGVSLQCGSCHTAYTSPSYSDASYASYTATATYTTTAVSGSVTTTGTSTATYTGNDFRHPTEVDASKGFGTRGKNPAGPITVLNTTVLNGVTTTSTATMQALRLASNANTAPVGMQTNSTPLANYGNQAYVTCLTCHNAHGSSAAMVGFAAAGPAGASSAPSPAQDASKIPHGVNNADSTWNVNPDYAGNSSTLLVADNRAVCESCHQKGSPTYQATYNGT